MLIQDRKIAPPTGFALFNLGFRPFFLFAAGWAGLTMAIWGYTLTHPSELASWSSRWHGHEMLFGYALAVVAGFLLTAARNWSGVPTPQGWALAGLLALWLAPRLVLLFDAESPGPWVAALDVGFDLLLGAVLLRTLWRNPANVWIFPPLLWLLALANLAWWLALLGVWPGGRALGLMLAQWALIGIVLVMIVRVLPFFIEKRLDVSVSRRVSAPVYRLGALLYGVVLVFDLAGWSLFSALASGALAALAAWVLRCWHVPGLWRESLLWVLWLAGLWLVLGLALKALDDPAGLARHALLVGVLGLATLGMMARVALGHTGRVVYPALRGSGWIFALILAGAVLRVLVPLLWPAAYGWAVPLAAWVWASAFAGFLVLYGVMLCMPRVDGKPG